MCMPSDDNTCAACGKDGEDLKRCACRLVKYCSVQCQKAHRSEHKRECKRAVKERAALQGLLPSQWSHIDTLSSDALFDPPPTRNECPLCFVPMPFCSGAFFSVSSLYLACCGKFTCSGCVNAANAQSERDGVPPQCPFCRARLDCSDEEDIRRCRQRIEAGCAESAQMLAFAYWSGDRGLTQNREKALELWKQSAEMGSLFAHYCLSHCYLRSDGVEGDLEKALYHCAASALGGHEKARHSLGELELEFGLVARAMKHFMIAACAGFEDSLKMVGKGYRQGFVAKADYERALRAFKASQDEMSSDHRSEALKARVVSPAGVLTLKSCLKHA